MSEPKFPKGTPEYDAYVIALRKALSELTPEQAIDMTVFGDPFEGTGLNPKTVFKGGSQYGPNV